MNFGEPVEQKKCPDKIDKINPKIYQGFLPALCGSLKQGAQDVSERKDLTSYLLLDSYSVFADVKKSSSRIILALLKVLSKISYQFLRFT